MSLGGSSNMSTEGGTSIEDAIVAEDDGAGVAESKDWKKTLNDIAPCVVVLRITSPKTFDTEFAGCSYATGFVVDASIGIILTNRHVVKAGPSVIEAIFLNQEEVPVQAMYRDPVHDFGFLRFDPSAVKFLKFGAIPLAPEAAQVGLEVRVVGNDSGEKLSILAGTIARIDREAPHYSKTGYNDFNTFYLQASSGTKGGSSGSPVVSIRGQAVGMNAGSKKKGAAAYYLPLDRVVSALKVISSPDNFSSGKFLGKLPPRGTLQAVFTHKGFAEIRRLGLPLDLESTVRTVAPAGETGMLVVDCVVPGGPGDRLLEPGDILISVDGKVTTRFVPLESYLDSGVGGPLTLVLSRSGEEKTVTVEVQDLQELGPGWFLEIGGSLLHPLSYQQARNFFFPVGQVYVAESGGPLARAGVVKHAIIKAIGGTPVLAVKDYAAAYQKLTPGARVAVEWVFYSEPHRTRTCILTLDVNDWYGAPKVYTRHDSSGLWDMECQLDGLCLSPPLETPQNPALNPTLNPALCPAELSSELGEEGVCSTADALNEDGIRNSLVVFDVNLPAVAMVDGVQGQRYSGTGLVLLHSDWLGIAAVDRNTLPVSLADVILTFAGHSVETSAKVIFVHPMYNFALVAYDPKSLEEGVRGSVKAARLLPGSNLERGDSVFLVGFNRSHQLSSRKSVVTNAAKLLKIGRAATPRFRAINQEVVEIDMDFGSTFSGALVNSNGAVYALYSSFYSCSNDEEVQFVKGVPIEPIWRILRKILSAAEQGPVLRLYGGAVRVPAVRLLEVELGTVLLAKARHLGLSDQWVNRFNGKDPTQKNVLYVTIPFAGSNSAPVLLNGDILLAVNGEPVTSTRDIDIACHRIDDSENLLEDSVELTVLRQRQEISLRIKTDTRSGFGTERVVSWAGCLVQGTHPAVRGLGYLPNQGTEGTQGDGVFVVRWFDGSPAHRYGLFAQRWIVQVNKTDTPNLDAFVAAITGLKHGDFVRVKSLQLSGKPKVLTVKLDLHYWPTWQLAFDFERSEWKRSVLQES